MWIAQELEYALSTLQNWLIWKWREQQKLGCVRRDRQLADMLHMSCSIFGWPYRHNQDTNFGHPLGLDHKGKRLTTRTCDKKRNLLASRFLPSIRLKHPGFGRKNRLVQPTELLKNFGMTSLRVRGDDASECIFKFCMRVLIPSPMYQRDRLQ